MTMQFMNSQNASTYSWDSDVSDHRNCPSAFTLLDADLKLQEFINTLERYGPLTAHLIDGARRLQEDLSHVMTWR
jgi:hypothetical protein